MVSLLFPTTGRADRAAKCLQGFIDTTAPHHIQVCAEIDNDLKTQHRLIKMQGVMNARVQWSVAHNPEYRGRPNAWNDALEMARGEYIVFGADDLVWHKGWLDAALAEMAKFPGGWGLVGLNDGHADYHEAAGRGADFATHYLMHRRFVLEVLGGRVAWPFYGHSKNDRETNERARRADRFRYCADALVTHEHYEFGDREKDPTDLLHLGRWGSADRAYYEREAAGFPDDLDPVITS